MASAGFGSATASPSHSTNAHANLRSEASSLARQVNRLLNRQLSSVCQVNGVKSTGIKAELQRRIHNRKFRDCSYTIHSRFHLHCAMASHLFRMLIRP
ncbi:Uncharacterized protein HZ326_10550 [Fusarium oxysporum f. sp. albedinis]|nr:Uncharacterized protein HZ326_10550 [Fusarium oxysporum f. sp. albedinis]